MLTLPKWFWILYSVIIFSTLISCIINRIRQRYSVLAAITIIFTLLVPLVSFVYVVGRTSELDWFDYVWSQFKARDSWALFIGFGHLYLVVWWGFFVSSFSYTLLIDGLKRLFGVVRNWFSQVFTRKDVKGDEGREKQ